MSPTPPRRIADVAADLGLDPEHVLPYGRHKAKVALEAFADRPPKGKLVLVSAITPTRAGEGKTTTSVGLSMGLAKRGVPLGKRWDPVALGAQRRDARADTSGDRCPCREPQSRGGRGGQHSEREKDAHHSRQFASRRHPGDESGVGEAAASRHPRG